MSKPISKRNKTLILALVVLLLLAGGYYGSIVMEKKKAESANLPSAAFTNLELGHLESSELVKIEVPGILLEKNSETWELGSSDRPGIELDQRQIQILTYSLASLRVERIVDEAPEELSVYGLENPSSRTAVTDSAGKSALYLLGDMTPSRASYYIMEDGDPKVYSISAFFAEFLRFTLDGIRQRTLFPAFEHRDVKLFLLEASENRIEIIPKQEPAPVYLSSSYSAYALTSPYMLPRGINMEAMQNLLKPLSDLTIEDFVDDDPPSLFAYGLDNPLRIYLKTADNAINLEIGNKTGERRYAKLPDSPGVFTLGGMENFFNLKPISLIDRFALLVNITTVDHITITGGERSLNADLFDQERDSAFILNGQKAEEKSFRAFYEKIISLQIEAEYPQTGTVQPVRYNEDGNEVIIEYRLNTPPGARASFRLLPYNRDFYALLQEGTIEFLISRNQVRSIFDAADAMVYE